MSLKIGEVETAKCRDLNCKVGNGLWLKDCFKIKSKNPAKKAKQLNKLAKISKFWSHQIKVLGCIICVSVTPS